MARTTAVKKAWRSLAWLAVLIVGLIGVNAAGAISSNTPLTSAEAWIPELALDLQGGTQIILQPQLESGQTVTTEQLQQAVEIMRARIDASGVSEAEITTQGLGGSENVVVSIPGVPDDETRERIESSAKLEFRPVLMTDIATSAVIDDDDAEPTPTAEPTDEPAAEPTPAATPTDASDLAWVTDELAAEYESFDCDSIDAVTANVAPAGEPLIACDDTGQFKYLLGPVEVSGETITDASAGIRSTSQGVSTGEWKVDLSFNDEGTSKFEEVGQRLITLTPPQNQFAVVLDGRVITAPRVLGVTGTPEISGSFTQDSAQALADQLKFGALPIGFETQSSQVITATLGQSQLIGGLIAGVIGLALVALYSLVQYRALGMVTLASLVVAALITYLIILFFSWRYGYRLSLAGVAGLIVAIGITADSFIVYFERVKDELRDGRGLESAVEAGWKRAFRTILASDSMSVLAALILFLLAVGNVRGFALTLGLITVVDLLVVALFTHPMLQMMGRTRFFGGGHPLSGLNPDALGAVYRGRAQFRAPVATTGKQAASVREAARRQTIAERKAAELVDSSSKGKDS